MAGKKTGKRLLTWVLVLVMALSLLPLNALADDIPTEYSPTIEWKYAAFKYHSLTVEVVHEGHSLGTIFSTAEHSSAKVELSNDSIEVYDSDATGGSYSRRTAKLFTFDPGSTKGYLKLYTRSTAGHKVTVNYVFNDGSGKTEASVEQVKYQDKKSFPLDKKNYSCTFEVTSGDAKAEKNALGKLVVTGGTRDSDITVTYTPEKNIYIDKYFDNGTIFSKWNGEKIKLNGYEFVENNKLAEKSVIANSDLTPAMENYRFLTVTNKDGSDTVYDFSYAVMLPRPFDETNGKLTDVWYDRDEGLWYYSHLNRSSKLPVVNEGSINFCYNTVHNENSTHHMFELVKTVDPTCTEDGYSLYKCAYCAKTEQRDQTAARNHDWGSWTHDAATTGAKSTHTRICQRNASHTETERCTFTEDNGMSTCNTCGYSYGTHTAPTYPVYVYAFFAHDNKQLKGDVTVNGKPIEWNEDANNEEYKEYFVTLGVYRNGTTQEPTDGATGLVLKDLNDTEYEAAEITSQGNGAKNDVTLNDITDFPSSKVCKGAAGYPKIGEKLSWHLDGQVDVYTVTYDYNDGTAQGTPTSNGYYFGSYTIAAAPKRDGYTFTGWKDGDTAYQADDEITLKKDLKLVAQWTARTDLSYTVNYLEQGTDKVLHEKKIQTGVTFDAKIKSADEKIEIDGYNYANADKETLTIGTGENVINLYYTKRTDLSYTVHYYLKNTTKPVANDKRVNGQTFNAVVKEEAIRISGYRVYGDSVKSITIGTGTNEIIFYYTRTYHPSTPSKPTLNTGDHYAYVMGYPDGMVRPNGSITRAEVSTILFRLLSDKTRDEYFTTESSFTDVKAGAWYNNSIATLEKAGVIVDTAKGGAFRPNEAITRAELAAMLAQFSDAKPVKGVKFSDVSAEHWAYEAIAIAAKMGWIEGYPDGTFRPDATITRAEMMTLVNRALERVPSDEDHLLSKRVMLTFPDCKSGDWFYIAVQEATNSHTYERAATEKNGDEQWTALRANRDWTQLEK